MLILDNPIPQSLDHPSALPCHIPVQPLVVGASGAGIPGTAADQLQYLHDQLLGGTGVFLAAGVVQIEDDAAIGTGQPGQTEGVGILAEEPPDLGLLPAPAIAQGLQSQHGAVLAKLDGRSQEGECVAVVPEDRVAPQIQPGIRFTKDDLLLCQPLGDISGHAKKPVAGRDIYSSVGAFGPGAFAHPVGDAVGQQLGFGIQRVGDVTQLLEPVKGLDGLLAAADAGDALDANDAACPHTGLHGILMAAVDAPALAEGRTGGQPEKSTQQPLCIGDQMAGQLDPLVFVQTFHGYSS